MTKAQREKLHQREIVVSRLKLVLIIVCLIAIPVTFWLNHSDLGSVSKRVTNVESPCIRYGAKSSQCKEAFEQAVLTITHPEACAILRKAGLEIIECAHARLRQERTRHNERERSREGQPQAEPGETQSGGSKENPVRTPQPGGAASHPGQPHHAEPHAPSHSPHPQPAPQPSEPTSTPSPTQPSSPQAEQSTEGVEPPASEPPPSASPAPGLIESPGGLVGEVVCGLNRLVPGVCSE